MANAERA
jgi:hypothetical protein